MIKRLKRRFIIVNMSILTCVLVSILVSVFVMMYSSEVTVSNELMESIMMQMRRENNLPHFNENEPMQPQNILPENTNNNFTSSGADDVTNIFQLVNNSGEQFGMPNERGQGGFPNNEQHLNPQPQPYNGDNRFQQNPDPNERSQNENYNNWQEPDEKDDSDKDDDTGNISDSDDEDDNNNDESQSEKKPVTTSPPSSNSNSSITGNNNSDRNNSDNHGNNDNADNSPNLNEPDKPADSKPSVSQSTVTTSAKAKTTTTVSTSITAANTPLIITDEKREPPNDMMRERLEMDPFKGRVKRPYVYVEFTDVDQLEKIVYQYSSYEDDDAVKEAAVRIFDDNKESGTITLGSNKYRYLFQYEPRNLKYSIVMLDRTLEINTIDRLLFIFLFIAGGGFILIAVISFLLANWTIKPVEKAWTQQKEFIANASHELKTPLTVISTNTDVILASPEDQVKNQSKWLNYIKNETDRMAKLVNSLLYIAKYDANRIEMVYSKVDMSNLVSSICLQYEPLAFEKHKTLVTDIDEDIHFNADEDKIKQVVNILMDNAMKYSLPDGTIKVSLKSPKASSLCLTISNNSDYISPESLEKVFDRFYRVDDSRNRKTGGSGLGLNIAKTIVENHKGNIHAVHKNGITAFTVNFDK